MAIFNVANCKRLPEGRRADPGHFDNPWDPMGPQSIHCYEKITRSTI